MDDGCWMMLMVDGWKRQRGIFLMLHCSPVGDGSGWPFSGTGGLETWPGGFCGGGPDSDHPRSGHRPHMWTMQPSIVDLERETWPSFFRYYPLFMFQYVPLMTPKDSLSRVSFFAGFTDDIWPCPHPNSKRKREKSLHPLP